MGGNISIYETLEETVKPARTALLVIDVQNDLCKNDDSRAMVVRLRQFIDSCRQAGVFIVYLQNTTQLDGSSTSASEIARRKKWGMRPKVTVDGTWGHKIVELVVPGETEPVVRKHRMSAFTNTTLEILLRNRNIETVLCTGVATHGCVLSTAYSAMARDYYVIVVGDCVASSSRELHDLSLTLMKKVLHHVVSSEQLIGIWSQRPSEHSSSFHP